jgi:virginiamycin B lyase
MKLLPAVLVLALSASIAACSSGGAITSLPGLRQAARPSAARPNGHRRGTGALVLRIHVPKRKHRRGARYISPATQGISIAISGPTNVNETAQLTPTATGCASSLAGTYCTLIIAGLAPCPTSANCYSGTISTWDAVTGCPAACAPAGNELSANQNVAFSIAVGQSNPIGVSLGGIAASVLLVAQASSSFTGSMNGGFTISKCGTDRVDVYGVDADRNVILGAGAPVPSLASSDVNHLAVSPPSPAEPNEFVLTRPFVSKAGAIVHLTVGVTPDADSGGTGMEILEQVTFNHDVCGVVTTFPLASNTYPNEIVAGPDGNMWFTEGGTGNIGMITTYGSVNEYAATVAAPEAIAAGPDNRLWFTSCAAQAIGKISTFGSSTAYPLPTPSANPTPNPDEIAAGPDGNMWFVEFSGNEIDKMTTSGTGLTRYTAGLSAGAFLTDIVAGPDGALWFTENGNGKVGRITTAGTITEYATPTSNSSPEEIALGPDGNLWFTENTANRIGKITTNGSVTEYTIPTSNARPRGITAGPDGAIWFTECAGAKIGRITTSGTVTNEYPVTNDIFSIATGSDGSLWFAEFGSGKIGRLQ